MICKKCGSENVNIQAVTTIVNKHHGCFWWLFFGWLVFLKWVVFFLPALIIKLIKGKKHVSKTHSEAVCQDCGYREIV